LLDAEA
jgi:hypothetical protein